MLRAAQASPERDRGADVKCGPMDALFRRARKVVLLAALAVCCPLSAEANEQSAALRRRAATELYTLDHERALATFREAVAADPNDPAAQRGLAIGLWLNI